MSDTETFTAFQGHRQLAHGDLAEVAHGAIEAEPGESSS